MNFIVHWGLSMLVKVIFPSPACCGISSATQWSLLPASCLLLLQESSLLLGDSCSYGIGCVWGASGKRADSQCTRDITFAQERGEIDAVAMLGGASCQAGFLVCRTNKVWLLGTVHPWAPLQGFRGHPPVKGDYEGEEVIPWEVTTEMARTWAYAGLQLQELQVPLQAGILLTVPSLFIWAWPGRRMFDFLWGFSQHRP